MADYKKPDHWQLKARKEGYPARSVYKLKEMDGKFSLLQSMPENARVLDLGAAPGSWSLYLLRKNPGMRLVAADLSPLSRQYDAGLFNGGNFTFIQGDFTDSAVRDSILSQGPYRLILSDAAPPTAGNRLIDGSRSLELAQTVLAYAESSLAENGKLLLKAFQSNDSQDLLRRMKTMFTSAKSYKPAACRGDSFEVYYLGLGFTARTV